MGDVRVRELVAADPQGKALWDMFDKYTHQGQRKFNPMLSGQTIRLGSRVLAAANKVDKKGLTDNGKIPGVKRSDVKDIADRESDAAMYKLELEDLVDDDGNRIVDADTVIDEVVFAFPETAFANELWAGRLMEHYGGLTPKQVAGRLTAHSRSIEREARNLSRKWNQVLKEADHFPEQVHFGVGTMGGGAWPFLVGLS